MSDNRLKILVVTPGEPPRVRKIRGGLPAIAEIVGGETEELCPFADTVSIVRGRRGDELRLPFNCLLRNGSGQPVDVIHGTFVVVGTDHGQFVSLSDAQILRYLDEFSRNRVSPVRQKRLPPASLSCLSSLRLASVCRCLFV